MTQKIYKSKCCNSDFYIDGDNYNVCRKCEDECDVVEVCEVCGGDGFVEVMGDGDNFEWDVIGTTPCTECANGDDLTLY